MLLHIFCGKRDKLPFKCLKSVDGIYGEAGEFGWREFGKHARLRLYAPFRGPYKICCGKCSF